MQDNFDLAGYLRKNNMLLNELNKNTKIINENIGGYVDLKPVKEEKEDLGGWDGDGEHDQYDGEYDHQFGPAKVDEADGEYGSYGPWGKPDENEENPWMMDVDGMGEYEVGQFKCYYDYPGYLVWSYSDVPFDKFAVYATPLFDGHEGTPVQVDVNEKTVANLDIPKGIFKNFQDYAKIMVPVLTRLVEKYSDQFEGELEELEKPEKIYADDEDEYGNQDRMFDLGGQQIEQGIIDLLDDGFEPDEVLDMCKMFIDAHVEAAAKGKKF